MKITIIGGGNMGGAIARGLEQGSVFKPADITVTDIHQAPLDALKNYNPDINTVLNDYNTVQGANIILLAVKPWLISDVIDDIKFQMDYSKQILISIAAGVTIESIEKSLHKHSDEYGTPAIFRLIPNTAIAVRQSMTLIASHNASTEQEELLLKIFNELGNAILLDESKIAAGTALTSCGIAYLFRYVRAAMLAGVEMGFYPKEAQDMVVNHGSNQ